MPRPSTPLISRDAAAKAALEVIDEVGLDGFSLDRVAKKLGVRPPSLYHHFKHKAEILEDVTRLLFQTRPSLKSQERSFEEQIIALCLVTRRSLLRHPKAAVLVLQFFPRHLLLKAYDDAADADPYPPEFKMVAVEATEKLTFGSALFAAAAQARGVPAMPPVDGGQFPALAEAIRQNPFDDEELFEEILRVFFAGMAERYRHQTQSLGAAMDAS